MASSVFGREQERTVLTSAGNQSMPHKDGKVGGHWWNAWPQEHLALLLAALLNLIKMYSESYQKKEGMGISHPSSLFTLNSLSHENTHFIIHL